MCRPFATRLQEWSLPLPSFLAFKLKQFMSPGDVRVYFSDSIQVSHSTDQNFHHVKGRWRVCVFACVCISIEIRVKGLTTQVWLYFSQMIHEFKLEKRGHSTDNIAPHHHKHPLGCVKTGWGVGEFVDVINMCVHFCCRWVNMFWRWVNLSFSPTSFFIFFIFTPFLFLFDPLANFTYL